MANATSYMNFQIALIPENAAKIDQINRIILGEAYTTTSTPVEKPAAKTTAKTAAKNKAEDAIAADEQKVASDATSEVSLDDLKKAAKKAKADHGEDFAMQVLKDADVAVAATLGRSMGKIAEDQYADVISAWEAGPQVTEQAADEPEDDGFGDDDDLGEDTSEVTADAVKTALKAYAKDVGRDEAKEIMNKHGASALSKVDDCSAKQLSAMFAELVI